MHADSLHGLVQWLLPPPPSQHTHRHAALHTLVTGPCSGPGLTRVLQEPAGLDTTLISNTQLSHDGAAQTFP